VMLVALQLVAVAVVPLNFNVLAPCVAPKFAPVIVTDAPTSPDVGFKLVIPGVEVPSPDLSVAGETSPAQELKQKAIHIVRDRFAPVWIRRRRAFQRFCGEESEPLVCPSIRSPQNRKVGATSRWEGATFRPRQKFIRATLEPLASLSTANADRIPFSRTVFHCPLVRRS
jgi:hypothetical protein